MQAKNAPGAERSRLERRLLQQIRALRARIDPAILRPAVPEADTPVTDRLVTDRRAVGKTVVLFLSSRGDGGRLMRDILADLAQDPLPSSSECGTRRVPATAPIKITTQRKR